MALDYLRKYVIYSNDINLHLFGLQPAKMHINPALLDAGNAE